MSENQDDLFERLNQRGTPLDIEAADRIARLRAELDVARLSLLKISDLIKADAQATLALFGLEAESENAVEMSEMARPSMAFYTDDGPLTQ